MPACARSESAQSCRLVRSQNSTAPFADAARVMGGEGLATLVAAGAALSCFGALNGWILVAGQMPLAIADDGLFPKMFAYRGAANTPVRGILLSATLSTVLIGMNYTQSLVALFTRIILLATLSTLVPYVFCSLASFLRPNGAGNAGAASLLAHGRSLRFRDQHLLRTRRKTGHHDPDQ